MTATVGSHWPARLVHVLRWPVAALVLVVALEYLVLPQLAGLPSVFHALARVAWPLTATAVLLELASLASYSALTKLVLPPGRRLGFFTVFRIDLSDLAVNHVVPGGGTTAAAVRYRLLTHAGTRPQDALSAATIEIIGSNLVLGAVFGLGLLSALATVHASGYYLVAGAIVIAGLCLALTGLVLLDRHLEGAVSLVRGAARLVRFIRQDAAENFIRTMASQADMFRREPRRLLVAAALAGLNWILDAAALWVMVAAFGHFLGIGQLLIAYSLAGILAMLPITPGGIGLVEAVLIPTLTGFRVRRVSDMGFPQIGYQAFKLLAHQRLARIEIRAAQAPIDRDEDGSLGAVQQVGTVVPLGRVGRPAIHACRR